MMSEICTSCGSTRLIRQINTNKINIHYGSLICGSCARHIKWLPHPSIDALHQERQQVIDAALASNRVLGWEAYFLRSIRERRHLSPKQQSKLEQILANQKPLTSKVGVVAIA